MKNINARIITMHSNEQDYISTNIILLNGELAYVADKGQFKIGDGTTPFNDLPYLAGNGSFKGTIDSVDQLPPAGNVDGDQYLLGGQLYIYADNQWNTVEGVVAIDNTTIKKNESKQIYVDSLNVNKLTQTEGDTLILYCGGVE